MGRTRIRGRDLRIVDPGFPVVDRDETVLQRGRYFRAVHSSLSVGDIVQARATVGTLPVVELADPHVIARMLAVGMIVDLFSAAECTVAVIGELVTVGLTKGAEYFVGSDSRILAGAPPVPPGGGLTVVQRVGTAIAADRLLLGFESRFIIKG